LESVLQPHFFTVSSNDERVKITKRLYYEGDCIHLSFIESEEFKKSREIELEITPQDLSKKSHKFILDLDKALQCEDSKIGFHLACKEKLMDMHKNKEAISNITRQSV
jgi:hypothetical protein